VTLFSGTPLFLCLYNVTPFSLHLQQGSNSSDTLHATRNNALQHTTIHCNTLQHTATHCNTLQHTTPAAEAATAEITAIEKFSDTAAATKTHVATKTWSATDKSTDTLTDNSTDTLTDTYTDTLTDTSVFSAAPRCGSESCFTVAATSAREPEMSANAAGAYLLWGGYDE